METVIYLLFDKINVIKRIYYFQITVVFSSPFFYAFKFYNNPTLHGTSLVHYCNAFKFYNNSTLHKCIIAMLDFYAISIFFFS